MPWFMKQEPRKDPDPAAGTRPNPERLLHAMTPVGWRSRCCVMRGPEFLDGSQGRKTRGQRHRHRPESTCGELPTPGVKPVSSNQKCFATTADPSVAKMIVQPIACQNARAEDARSLVVPACFQQLTPIAAR